MENSVSRHGRAGQSIRRLGPLPPDRARIARVGQRHGEFLAAVEHYNDAQVTAHRDPALTHLADRARRLRDRAGAALDRARAKVGTTWQVARRVAVEPICSPRLHRVRAPRRSRSRRTRRIATAKRATGDPDGEPDPAASFEGGRGHAAERVQS